MNNVRAAGNLLKQTAHRTALCVFLAAGLSVVLAGCQNLTWRGQSPDPASLAEKSRVEVSAKEIRTVAGINGLDFAPIEGIGLVTGLAGTGSDPVPSWQKDHLLEEMKLNRETTNPASLLAGPDTSMVLVKGLIPPGARKGDPIDLEVILPPDSETTSLEHGILSDVRLKPMAYLGRKVREGKALGIGGGTVVVNSVFESRQDEANQIRGIVPGGGRLLEDRDMSLVLRPDAPPMVVTQIANAINSRFTVYTASGRTGVAETKTDRVIQLAVPDVYRNNIGRYVEVLMGIVYAENPDERVNRLEALDRQLDSPATAYDAALHLEGMGKDGLPALRRALQSPDMETSFRSAEALAYMGISDGRKVLLDAAANAPELRWNAFAALSSLPDVDAALGLGQLMSSSSAETRYGSFRALYMRSPNDPQIRGELLPTGFHLHVVPSQNEPMLHLSRGRRQEIVIFNDEQFVNPSMVWVQAGITIQGDGVDRLRITQYRKSGGDEVINCSTRVSELIRTLASRGSNYSEIASLLRGLKQQEHLPVRLVVDALPKPSQADATELAGAAKSPAKKPADEPASRTAGKEKSGSLKIISGMKNAFSKKEK